jgi:uncharacterized membrane protein
MQIHFINQEISVIVTGMLPIFEVRGALLLAFFYYNFSPIKAYLLSVFGNLLPIIPVFLSLTFFTEYFAHKIYFLNRFLNWLYEKTRERHGDHFESYRFATLALFIFVAIPIPFTGAWSGILAAIVFGIPFWKAVTAIASGVLVSGAIVMAISLFGMNIEKYF